MENLKYGLFDLFVYALPGSFIIFCSVYVVKFDVAHPLTMIDPDFFEKDFHLLSIIIFIVCAYVTGFVMCTLGNYLLKLTETIIKAMKKGSAAAGGVSKSAKYVITREFAKENQKSIELWNVMKNFSASIALSLLILSIRYYFRFSSFGILHLIVGLGLSAALMCRSMEYHRWVRSDLDNAYNKFKDKT